MTGLGYYGSSSTSNLSPLAPPFTVDRSNHTKPVVNSNPFSHSYDPHSTNGQQFFADSSTATNSYGPIVSDLISNSLNWSGLSSNELGRSNWSDVNPSPHDSSFYCLNEAKNFHHLVKKDDAPLVSFSETNGTDYTQNLIGLEYNPNPNPNPNPKQGGVSSRLSVLNEARNEKMKKDDSFFFGEASNAASFAYTGYLNQGAYGTEALSKDKDDAGMLYYADMIRRANDNGKSDGTSFFANTHGRLDSNEFTSHSSVVPSPEDPFWNSPKLTPPYEKRNRHILEDFKPTTKSSPIVIRSPPAPVSVGSSHTFLKEKDELRLPQLSFQVGTTSSIKDTKLSPANDQLNFEFKAKPSLPDINIPDAASSFDQHNSAEDSPCWKGTPSFTFGSPETQPATKKLQKSTSIQGTDHSLDGKPSSSPIPFHADTGEVVDSLKVGGGGDDANPQIPKVKLPSLEEAANLLAEMHGEAGDTKVNASVLVKAVYNLSDLLLRACSDEALKEHDLETLDRVIHNLGVCMPKKGQVADAFTNKVMPPYSNISNESQAMNETSGTLQDGEQHAHYQTMKSIVSGESVKNLLEHVSPRDLDPPKGDNMVQAIKKVLDENLECEMEPPSETTLLYKDLWLEAEAELCCLSYRARFERLKRETQKEKPLKSTATGGASARKETSNAQHIDDVVNVHGGQNPVKEGPVTHVADVKATGSGATVQYQPCKDDDDDDGVDSWVIARLNILKRRDELNAIDLEEAGPCEEEAAAAVGSGSDWEHILKDEVNWRLS